MLLAGRRRLHHHPRQSRLHHHLLRLTACLQPLSQVPQDALVVRGRLCLRLLCRFLLGGFWSRSQTDKPKGWPCVLFPDQRLLRLLVQRFRVGQAPDGRVEVA